MRKSVKIITGFLLTAILSAAAVFASFSDRLDVVNHISVGDVSISISEYARKGKGEVKYTQPSEVVPGQTISKMHFPAGSGPESHMPGKTENWNA